MTPKDQDLKKLAEKVAEWLGYRVLVENGNIIIILDANVLPCLPYLDLPLDVWADLLFHHKWYPAILLHLAQEKAEREGFGWSLSRTSAAYYSLVRCLKGLEPFGAKNENKFIAFYTALMEAVKARKPVTGEEG